MKPEKLFENGPDWLSHGPEGPWGVNIAGHSFELANEGNLSWLAECDSEFANELTLDEALAWLRKRIREHAAELVRIVGTEWRDDVDVPDDERMVVIRPGKLGRVRLTDAELLAYEREHWRANGTPMNILTVAGEHVHWMDEN